ncbi:MAG: polyprenyl synthetase family protein [Pseudonocardiaceae bacterium]
MYPAPYDNWLKSLKVDLVHEYQVATLPYGLDTVVPSLADGKYFRSFLARLISGSDSVALRGCCVSLEMLHTSTLVHDDMLDKATERRNKISVWQAIGPECGLLLGNLLANRALQLAATHGKRIWAHSLSCYERVNRAQLKDYVSRNDINRTVENYDAVVEGKTSAMLELAAILAASIMKTDQVSSTLMIRAMRQIGFVFQILDDMEDIRDWLAPSRSARSKTSIYDIDAGIYTLPAIFLLSSDAKLRSSLETNYRSSVAAHALRDPTLWETPFLESTSRAARHLETARKILHSGGTDKLAPELVRLHGWVSSIGEDLLGPSLDTAILEAMRRGENHYDASHD